MPLDPSGVHLSCLMFVTWRALPYSLLLLAGRVKTGVFYCDFVISTSLDSGTCVPGLSTLQLLSDIDLVRLRVIAVLPFSWSGSEPYGPGLVRILLQIDWRALAALTYYLCITITSQDWHMTSLKVTAHM